MAISMPRYRTSQMKALGVLGEEDESVEKRIRRQAAQLPQLYAAKETEETRKEQMTFEKEALDKNLAIAKEEMGLYATEIAQNKELAAERDAINVKIATMSRKSEETAAGEALDYQKGQDKWANIIGGASATAKVIEAAPALWTGAKAAGEWIGGLGSNAVPATGMAASGLFGEATVSGPSIWDTVGSAWKTITSWF